MTGPTEGPLIPSSGWDVVVVGSGFGGTLAAHYLVGAGLRVLMLERGGWVARGPHNRAWEAGWGQRDGFCDEAPYQAEGETSGPKGGVHCVGGPSVFYGGVALRLREGDLSGRSPVSPNEGWPIEYADLAPHYDEVERLLGVSGDETNDPVAPPRSRPLPPPGLPLSPTSQALERAARHLGMHPFRLPLAVNHRADQGRRSCTGCGVCDGFACAIGAKNDLATTVLPSLLQAGMHLRPNTVVTRLEMNGSRVAAVRAVDRNSGAPLRFEGRQVVVAAGALGTPHLLLASGLQVLSPAGQAVGATLMRHCNGVVVGAAPPSLGAPEDFRKQLGIHDFYYGDDDPEAPDGRLGSIQQIRATRIALAMAPLPAALKKRLHPSCSRLVGLMVMAEDQPDPANRIYLDPSARDRWGRPVARVHHRHTPRDQRARRALARRAREILREAGAAFTFMVPVRTFSHALGTVRMGWDRKRDPLTPSGRFRGTRNLWVTDASSFPTAAAVNPSLTVAANARRIAGAVAAAAGASSVAVAS